MFPYPSGDLHMGHAEAYAFGDVVARYWRQRGFNVLHPIGWDSFGLPAENAAIKRGANPVEWTYDNIEQQKRDFRRYGVSFDWTRVLHTSDPEYYKWNQWLFLKLYEKGLAYRKESWVNWDPNDQTVLANEQVLPDGTSERSGAVVVKKKLTQWYFKITDYADRLLDDLNQLEGSWPQQGHRDAAQLDRPLDRRRRSTSRSRAATSRSPCSRPAPTRSTARRSWSSRPTPTSPPNWRRARRPRCRPRSRTTSSRRRSRPRSSGRMRRARRPASPSSATRSTRSTASGCPIWTADYVLADYGHGAVMAVPAHDQRDLDFARKFDLPVRVVVDTNAPVTGAIPVIVDGRASPDDLPPLDPATTGIALIGEGRMINSGPLDGLSKRNAITTHHRAARGRGHRPRREVPTGCATG